MEMKQGERFRKLVMIVGQFCICVNQQLRQYRKDIILIRRSQGCRPPVFSPRAKLASFFQSVRNNSCTLRHFFLLTSRSRLLLPGKRFFPQLPHRLSLVPCSRKLLAFFFVHCKIRCKNTHAVVVHNGAVSLLHKLRLFSLCVPRQAQVIDFGMRLCKRGFWSILLSADCLGFCRLQIK